MLAVCLFFVATVVAAPPSLLKAATATDPSDEIVMTPAGPFPRASMHLVPDGARVHQSENVVQILASDGTIIHSATVAKAVSKQPTLTSLAPRALSSGYVAYSYWKNNGTSPISSFSTSWTVPPVPAKKDGQLLYIFNALIPNSFDGIFQPVLQFGSSPAGGGNYWAVASWFLVNSNIYFTAPDQVKSGKVLSGVMTLKSTTTSNSTVTYNWNSIFTGVPSTSLSISSTEVFNYAYEALEIYSVSRTSDLPTGKTAMTAINIVTQDGKHPALNWTSVSDTTDGFQLAVIKNGATDGEVDIVYA
ncbi:hypothetical protein GALMADRAFT_145746 [Galerina marginata CBS 339.88]|uniref:Uncharacterized protein n=1 Tax=Galerina marginata (strain CBS 339.88) TaxID=685588 RepID=A0A067SG86_GALM3|nr:hypothetical protein GALMADRAFT_145746 [Galerina marginata CBS 339.88]